jgi:hypothetical protein
MGPGCARCGANLVGDGEFCWYCEALLCANCWEQIGHCGHLEAEATNVIGRLYSPPIHHGLEKSGGGRGNMQMKLRSIMVSARSPGRGFKWWRPGGIKPPRRRVQNPPAGAQPIPIELEASGSGLSAKILPGPFAFTPRSPLSRWLPSRPKPGLSRRRRKRFGRVSILPIPTYPPVRSRGTG